MASAVAVELAGGPHIPLRYGRMDAESPEDCTPDGARRPRSAWRRIVAASGAALLPCLY